MSKGSFLFGLGLGIAAGIAAKVVYDNKEEIMDYALDAYYIAKDEVNTFVDHAMEKAGELGEGFTNKANEYKEYTASQLEELKSMINEAKEEDDIITE